MNATIKLGLFLAIISQNLFAAQAPSTSAKVPTTIDQFKQTQLKFNDENNRLTLEHQQKMKELALANTNTIFNKSIENQKALDKLSRESIIAGKDGSEVNLKAAEFRNQITQLNNELNAKLQTEDSKFFQLMQKRSAEHAAQQATNQPAVPFQQVTQPKSVRQ